MAAASSGKLEKLKILSYKDKGRSDDEQEFEVMFNPESYSLTHQNKYDRRQGINTSGVELGYAFSRPKRLKVKLIIDGTGVNVIGAGSEPASDKVHKDIEKFLKLTGHMDGDIHQPRFLKLRWGELIFKCRLSSVQINYSLFNKSGIPLRAELDVVFIEDLETSTRSKQENKSSPDLTHSRMVKMGDQLPLMCEGIYGSSKYYLKVARINGLRNFRDLKPGQQLFFPPLRK